VIRLPPLNALRAFEAAARHGSFPAAARELNVTAGAIGRQVRLLEDYLGVELFHRHPHGVELTELARQALPKLEEGFACLAGAAELLRSPREAPVLILQAPPGLAAKWLVPRLQRFAEAHPGIELRLSAERAAIDAYEAAMPAPIEELGQKEAIAIRYGAGPYLDVEAIRLFEIDIRPVCSPEVLAAHPLASPDDLADHVLLHDETSHFLDKQPDWAVWLKAAGAQGVDPFKGQTFNQSALAMDAALQGMGVALGVSVLVEEELAQGRLVAPFELALPARCSYWLVIPPRLATQPAVQAFRDWLVAEAGRGGGDTA
jgi:LysR family transcriptional regulator, glycine cleavage system transcriptional activator